MFLKKQEAIEILEELRSRRGCALDSARGPEFIQWRHEIEAAALNLFPDQRSYLDSINSILDGGRNGQDADPNMMWSVDAVLSSMIAHIQKYWSDDGTAANPQGVAASATASEIINQHLRILENILRGTAMILEQQRLEPSNETEINRLVRTVVKAAFPDTVCPAIPTVLKTFRPEFGVPSLGALAEYKFADSEKEVRACLDGILADSRGYQTDPKWKRFYAVFFMTGAFFSQEQIDEQFKQSGISENWKAIVLVGRGGRKVKSGGSV